MVEKHAVSAHTARHLPPDQIAELKIKAGSVRKLK
jgi:hypothetical protein